MSDEHESPIDAVVTWVDGNDPIHRMKRQEALSREKRGFATSIPAGRSEIRFKNNGEIKYCLYALRRYAPWIRTIHLVTDGQCPDFLDEARRRDLGVSLVDHREIFRGYEWALPTFNSRTIETALHRIPGLAPRYLYLNDDIIVLRPITEEDFFNAGKVVLRGRWARLSRGGPSINAFHALLNYALKTCGILRTMSLQAQMEAARVCGFLKRYYRTAHAPHPIRRRTLESYFEEHPDVFERNIRFRFRSAEQFVATFLAHHLEIAKSTAHLISDDECLMVCYHRDSQRKIANAEQKLKAGTVSFLCLQSFEQAAPPQHLTMSMLLENRVFGQC